MVRRRRRRDQRPTSQSHRSSLGSRPLRLEPLEERRLLAITVTTHDDIVDANDDVTSLREAIEFLSTKVGLVLVVLGVMHFGNIAVFTRMRSRALLEVRPPPVSPSEHLAAFGPGARP